MSTRNVIHSMIEYHVASNRKLWKHIQEHLTDEQFTRETGFSHGSIRNQVVHLAATDRYWLHDIQSKPVTGLDPADYPTRASFTDTWENIGESLLDYVRSLAEAALEEVPDGLIINRWQSLVHVVNHGTDHRAQILSMVHGLGLPTFGQEFPDTVRASRWVTKEDVLGLVRYWNGRLQGSLDLIMPEQVDEPVSGAWTVKERLAQLAWYEREMAGALANRQVPESDLWKLPSQEREKRISIPSRDRSWEEILGERNEAHRSLLQAIEALEEEDFNDPSRFRGDPAGVKLWEMLEEHIWSQYMAHAEALWAWLDAA